MSKLMRSLAAFFLLPLLLALLVPQTASAADIRTGDQLIISEDEADLEDLYLFGGTLQLDAPVTNDLVFGGWNVTINGDVSGDLQGGGGNIIIRGSVGDTVRIGGGNITIDGPIANDLVISGGSITVADSASIGGDLLFAGGQLQLDAPVAGKILMSGGQITLNSEVGGDVNGNVGELSLGPDAQINGNLSYASPEEAAMASGSTVAGQTDYTVAEESRVSQEDGIQGLLGAGLYKLVVDIIISLLLIFFFQRGLTVVVTRMRASPMKHGTYGFAFFLLFPLASILLLTLLWLGITSFLTYALVMIVAIFIAKIFLGWGVLTWWQHRNKKQYVLDWKAGIIGPILLFILLLIPILGWLAVAILFFIAIGALLTSFVSLIQNHRTLPKSPQKK